MVRVGDMLKKKKGFGLGKKEEEAIAMFKAHAHPIPGFGDDAPLGVNFKVFQLLMKALVKWANEEALKSSVRDGTPTQPQFPIPSKKDLKAAFKMSDADKSGYVDEEEFMELFAAVIAGKVRGLGGGVDFYRRPYQLMQWGDADFHPDTDWQDLFFDLLFAGSAFCGAALLAESLVNGQAAEGFLWFLVMFLCLAQQWVMRTHYCGRFASTSLFHAIFVEELEFVCIALATWHIPLENTTKEASSYSYGSSYYSSGSRRTMLAASSSYGGDAANQIVFTPVDQLRGNVDGCVFGFSFFLGLNALIYVWRWAEIYSDPAASYGAKCIAKFSMRAYTAVAVTFFAASVLCLAAGDGTNDDYEDHLPAWCLLVWGFAHLLFIGTLVYWIATMKAKSEADAQAESVPLSVEYLIVRVGEWTMVMLGETVLSLLGVPLQHDAVVYFMFAFSMLIAGNLQFQGYTVHPIHADHHVLHNGQFSYKGLVYLIWATIWYATILVCVGTGAKVLTKKALYYDVYAAANWVFCGGLAAAFISILSFAALHHSESKVLGIMDCYSSERRKQKALTRSASSSSSSSPKGSSFRGGSFRMEEEALSTSLRMDLAKASTVVCHISFAVAELKPHVIVFAAFFVVLVQSGIIISEHTNGVEEEEEMKMEDIEAGLAAADLSPAAPVLLAHRVQQKQSETKEETKEGALPPIASLPTTEAAVVGMKSSTSSPQKTSSSAKVHPDPACEMSAVGGSHPKPAW